MDLFPNEYLKKNLDQKQREYCKSYSKHRVVSFFVCQFVKLALKQRGKKLLSTNQLKKKSQDKKNVYWIAPSVTDPL